jgi:hypothetical protein
MASMMAPVELAEVMFFMWVVGVTEIVEHSDRLHNALDSLLAKRSNAWRDYGHTAGEVLTQTVIERAYAFGPGIHG